MTSPVALELARKMIGVAGSRFRIPTPALVVDMDRLEANVAAMAARAARAGVTLRPHAKTHKSAFIAALQKRHGAVGACCAKVGEAEALHAEGVRGILVTSPVATEALALRCVDLARSDPDFMVTVDHSQGVEHLKAAAEQAGVTVNLVVDVDVGLGRTGVASVADAVVLATAISASPMLRFKGVQGYGGHWQHMKGAADRLAAIRSGMTRLAEVVEQLRSAGLTCEIITGGGTGSFEADVEIGLLSELQPGSYVFMDNQYVDALAGDPDGAFATALTVQTQIISNNAPKWLTTDAGLKAFATDGPFPRPVTQAFAAQTYAYFGDEHGRLSRPADPDLCRHGVRLEVTAPHCDPTVDRYTHYHLVRGDVLVGIARIDAAGCSQ